MPCLLVNEQSIAGYPGNEVFCWVQDLENDAPVIILLPGLTGGSHDTYVRCARGACRAASSITAGSDRTAGA